MLQINRDDLRALLAAGTVILVEALPAPHFDAEHLRGAVNRPGDLTEELAAELAPDPARTVVIYCSGRSCGRSTVAPVAFAHMGYGDVRVHAGGKADWADAGLPFEGTRSAPRAA